MGHAREKPARLAGKLLQVRLQLNLSQADLITHIGMEDKLVREDISKFERGVREPNLLTLLAYGRAAGVSTDALIDDNIDIF